MEKRSIMAELKPPIAKREDYKIKYHEKEFNDQYFWLRNKESDEVLSYLKAENTFFEQKMNPYQCLPVFDNGKQTGHFHDSQKG